MRNDFILHFKKKNNFSMTDTDAVLHRNRDFNDFNFKRESRISLVERPQYSSIELASSYS